MNASNDNAAPVIETFRLFNLGRSGRRVASRSGCLFGVELVWSNGAVTALSKTFPARVGAMLYAGQAIDAARAAGMVPA